MAQALKLPIIAGLLWTFLNQFLNKGPNFHLECLFSCWQFSLSPKVRPFRRSKYLIFRHNQVLTHLNDKLSPNSATAAFELSVFECGIYRTTLNNLVSWYFSLKKDTWLIAGQSELSGTTAYPSSWATQGPQKPSALVVLMCWSLGASKNLAASCQGLLGAESFGKTLTGSLTGCWTPEYLVFRLLGV